MKKLIIFLLILTAAVSACSKDDNTIAVAGISLDQSALSLSIEQTKTLTATILPGNASDHQVIWSSSDTQIATVAEGVVTALAKGTAKITAQTLNGDYTAVCTVTVGPAFPDAAFREELKKLGFNETNADINPLDATNRKLFAETTEISLTNKKITSLQGLEYFTSLTNFRCGYINLGTLDISRNTTLEQLKCNNCGLSTLDLSKNTALRLLYCAGNSLTALDISKNSGLTTLECNANQLTTLDLKANTRIQGLDCSANQITQLDLSKQLQLDRLYCFENEISALDLSKNIEMTNLDCNNNRLSGIDVSKNTKLIHFSAHHNLLTTLDVSKNTKLINLSCYYNRLSELDITALINLWPNNLRCGDQQPDKNLTLNMSEDQFAMWDTYKMKNQPENTRITEMVAQ